MIQFLFTLSVLASSFSSFPLNLVHGFYPRSSMFSHQIFSTFSTSPCFPEMEHFFIFLITIASILWFVVFFFVNICLSIRIRIIFHQLVQSVVLPDQLVVSIPPKISSDGFSSRVNLPAVQENQLCSKAAITTKKQLYAPFLFLFAHFPLRPLPLCPLPFAPVPLILYASYPIPL